MDLMDFASRSLSRLNPRLVAFLEKYIRTIPAVDREIQEQYVQFLEGIEEGLKPYKVKFSTYARLPEVGRQREVILEEMEAMREIEEGRWKDGFVSGAVYHGDQRHIEFLNKVYALNSQSNPLHADVWPSTTKYEAEIVSMTATMLGAVAAPEEIGGTVTSGGTESILLAMKTYRDRSRDRKGIKRPEIIVPVTAIP